MAENFRAEIGFELIGAQTCANFELELFAPERAIDDSFRPDMLDIGASKSLVNLIRMWRARALSRTRGEAQAIACGNASAHSPMCA